MSINWKNNICSLPGSVTFGDSDNYVQNSLNSNNSPEIDLFYEEIPKILLQGNEDYCNENPTLAPFLLVALVSNVERYYRCIFAHCIQLCPIARKEMSTKSVNLSSIYFGYNFIELSLFENQSFSDITTIGKYITNIFGVKNPLNENSSIGTLLKEFQKLCELRHSIVHCNGIINSKNAIALDLDKSEGHYTVKISYIQLQIAADICLSLVQASNILFFKELVNKWANQGNQHNVFRNEDKNQLLSKLYDIFCSQKDFEEGNSITKEEMLELIKEDSGFD